MTAAAPAPTSPAPHRRRRRWAGLAPALGVVPFFVYVSLFLLVPTAVVVIGAFLDDSGAPSLASLDALRSRFVLDGLRRSLILSGTTAVLGAGLGALLAYVVSTARPEGFFRRAVTSVCGVLAQFGGVTLAFAFLATVGFQGFITVWVRDVLGADLAPGNWLFGLPGLILIYTYFQIPLMVIVFLPALDGVRPQWREAAETLGGSTWVYWRRVAGPVLAPSFLGCTLLLFANAFSAYATAAALVSQGSPILPLQIRAALTSEVLLGQQNTGKALALLMVVVVAVVMLAFSRLQKRTSRWLG